MVVALAALAPADGRAWRALRRALATPALTLPAAVGLWGAAYAMETSGSVWVRNSAQLGFLAASGLLLGTVVAAGPWLRPVARVLAPVGLISYGIYLWHDIVVEVIRRHSSLGFHGQGRAWLADVALLAAITMPLAAASWFAVERPSMRRAAAWAHRRRAEPVPPRTVRAEGPA
jgi:peptidoglycan/LPS O-acetylase OafA/YrhL